MNVKVTFREYELPKTDSQTQEEERGEFIGSFTKPFTGPDAADINRQVNEFLESYRMETNLDVRVWHGQ